MLPSHASTEACLTGWPNAQPQGRDYCNVAQHHQANLMVCVVCSSCATSPYIYIYIYYEIVRRVHNKKKMKKRQGKNKNTK